LKRDLTRAQLFGLGRRLYEPREEGTIVDERRPEGCVPGDVLGDGRTGLTVEGSDIILVRYYTDWVWELSRFTHRQSKTTTVSLLAGIKPSMKTFLLPQL
jgi:hypothetical protein